VPNPFFGIFPTSVSLGASPEVSRETLLRPYPHFTSLVNNIAPWGRVKYHGLQTRFEKRMFGNRSATGAVTWILAYTWSKQLERVWRENHNYLWFSPVWQVTGEDRKHNFSFAGVWDLPWGKGRRFLNTPHAFVQAALGGWTANTTVIYQSGVPLGSWLGWESLCGSPNRGAQTETSWFFNDRSRFSQCWRQLRPYEYRQLEPNRFNWLRSHTAPQIDIMLSKKFQLNERIGLEFRGEAFNAFNTPLRGDAPSTNPQAADFGILPVAQLNFPRNIQLGMRVRF
jgi:hypothetical protein